jgi:GNAT superfamily N-acetyltransferase
MTGTPRKLARAFSPLNQEIEMPDLVRNATSADARRISEIIVAALRKSNARDYSPEVISQVAQSFSPPQVVRLIAERDVYVAMINDDIVATASLDQNIVRSVFVDPHHQRTGIGKRLMVHLECVAANHGHEVLRVPSSITAEGFYASLGFSKVRDEFHGTERTVVMEKQLV